MEPADAVDRIGREISILEFALPYAPALVRNPPPIVPGMPDETQAGDPRLGGGERR